MKKLLTGLYLCRPDLFSVFPSGHIPELPPPMMFSQVAVEPAIINEKNYNQYLCGPDLFVVPPSGDQIAEPPLTDQEIAGQSVIKHDYQVYCVTKNSYEQEVSDRNNYIKNSGTGRKDIGNLRSKACVEKQGILFAGACERLRQDKIRVSRAWKETVPKLAPCGRSKM
jgi:hypothetical protein